MTDFPIFSHRMSRGIAVGLAVAGLLTGVGCGSNDETSSTTAASTDSTSVPATSTANTTAPSTCVELLDRGCTGTQVQRLQRLLRSCVDVDLRVTGTFGPRTEEVLISFEEFRCPTATCTVDGRIVVNGPEWMVLVSLEELVVTEPSP